LKETFGIVFNRLYTITNQPIARFAEDLRRQGKWDQYLKLMAGSFNPAIVPGLMCRRTLSVDYRGKLYDCDFNQMLGLRMTRADKPGLYLWDLRRNGWSSAPFKPASTAWPAWPATEAVAQGRSVARGIRRTSCIEHGHRIWLR